MRVKIEIEIEDLASELLRFRELEKDRPKRPLTRADLRDHLWPGLVEFFGAQALKMTEATADAPAETEEEEEEVETPAEAAGDKPKRKRRSKAEIEAAEAAKAEQQAAAEEPTQDSPPPAAEAAKANGAAAPSEPATVAEVRGLFRLASDKISDTVVVEVMKVVGVKKVSDYDQAELDKARAMVRARLAEAGIPEPVDA